MERNSSMVSMIFLLSCLCTYIVFCKQTWVANGLEAYNLDGVGKQICRKSVFKNSHNMNAKISNCIGVCYWFSLEIYTVDEPQTKKSWFYREFVINIERIYKDLLKPKPKKIGL